MQNMIMRDKKLTTYDWHVPGDSRILNFLLRSDARYWIKAINCPCPSEHAGDNRYRTNIKSSTASASAALMRRIKVTHPNLFTVLRQFLYNSIIRRSSKSRCMTVESTQHVKSISRLSFFQLRLPRNIRHFLHDYISLQSHMYYSCTFVICF